MLIIEGYVNKSSVSKLIVRIFGTAWTKNHTPNEQSGFTAGRSCVDNILVLRQTMDKVNARNKELHTATIVYREVDYGLP